jgi:hypothetical protein
MKNTIRSLAFAVSVVIVGIALTLSNTMRTLHAQGVVNPNVEGTWSVMVTPDGGPPFRALASFASGGTVVESSAGGDNDKGGQGVWIRTGARTFGFTVEQFQYDAAGHFLGTMKVRERDEFDQAFASYTGVATIEFRDPAGILAFTACARTRATRMVVEEPSCH